MRFFILKVNQVWILSAAGEELKMCGLDRNLQSFMDSGSWDLHCFIRLLMSLAWLLAATQPYNWLSIRIFVGSGWSLLVSSLDDFAALEVMKVDDCQIEMSSLLYKETVIVFIVAPQNTNPTELNVSKSHIKHQKQYSGKSEPKSYPFFQSGFQTNWWILPSRPEPTWCFSSHRVELVIMQFLAAVWL